MAKGKNGIMTAYDFGYRNGWQIKAPVWVVCKVKFDIGELM